MLLENVSDFTHGFLHRKYQPFYGTEVLRCEDMGDRIEVEYKSKIAAGRFQNMFINRSESDCDHMLACYDYPYHWSNTDGRIKHFLFTLPQNDNHNRHMFIFYVRPDTIRLPLLGSSLPHWLVDRMMKAAAPVSTLGMPAVAATAASADDMRRAEHAIHQIKQSGSQSKPWAKA